MHAEFEGGGEIFILKKLCEHPPLPGRRRVPRVIAIAYSVFGFSTLLSAVPAHIPLKSGSGIHGPSSSQAKFSFHMQSFLHHDGSSRGRSKPPL